MSIGKNKNVTLWPINPDLVWDYDIPHDGMENTAFRRWYIARVLTRGRVEDVRAIGLRTILKYLPELILPPDIRYFWEWYFNLPETKKRYGITNTSTMEVSERVWP